MALFFSFLASDERIPAAEADQRVPPGVNRFEVIRIRSQLRLAECPAHHRAPRAIHITMTSAAPQLTIEHDCGLDTNDCAALNAELRRLVSLPHV